MISMDGLTTLYLMLPTSLIINLEQPRLRLSDDQAWQQIVRIAGVSNSSEFQKLDRETQWQVFIQLKELGTSVRQLQRLTGIDRGIIQKARRTKHLPQGACIPHLCHICPLTYLAIALLSQILDDYTPSSKLHSYTGWIFILWPSSSISPLSWSVSNNRFSHLVCLAASSRPFFSRL